MQKRKYLFACIPKSEQVDDSSAKCSSTPMRHMYVAKGRPWSGSSVYNNTSQRGQVRDHIAGARPQATERSSGGTGNLRKSRLDLTSDRVRFGARPIVAGDAWRTRRGGAASEPAAKPLVKKVAKEGTGRMRRRRRNSGCVSKGALYSNKVRYN